ncbi:hypothetical protein R6Q57_012242 [Mikania cordata]
MRLKEKKGWWRRGPVSRRVMGSKEETKGLPAATVVVYGGDAFSPRLVKRNVID